MENVHQAIASGNCTPYDIELLFVSSDTSRGNLVNEVCHNGLTPLCLACKLNRADLVPLLLQRGARTDVPSIYLKRFPLHYASNHSDGNMDMVNMLLAFGAQPNVQDEDGNTPLHLSCTESNVPVVRALLEAGSDVELTDLDDETPLVRACFAKSVELVDLLLKAGSDPNYPQGRPLEIVVRAPSVESLKLLIGAGARVTANTYLSFASEHNYLDMMKTSALEKVRLLLTYSVDVNRADATFTTPLITALTTRRTTESDDTYLTLIQLLLMAGARLTSSGLERIKVLIVYVQSSTSSKDELMQMLTKHTSEPLSLQCLCRIALRQRMDGNVDQKACSLPLPKAIINFVQFNDIPGCAYQQ